MEQSKKEKMMDAVKIYARRIPIVILGAFVCGMGVGMFYVPIDLLGGGLTAIAIFCKAMWGFNVAVVTLVLNVPILIIGYFFVNRSFMILSTIGMLCFTLGIQIASYMPVLTENQLTCIVGGGVVVGIGAGVMLRQNGSGGGMDVVCRILHKYFAIPIGNASLAVNSVLICIGGIFLGIDVVVSAILAIFISGRVINYIVEGTNYKRSVIIIAEKTEEIADALLEEFGRGVTVSEVIGAYSGQPKKQLMCAISPHETPKLRNIVLKIEPTAFVTITESISVIGGGFRDKSLY